MASNPPPRDSVSAPGDVSLPCPALPCPHGDLPTLEEQAMNPGLRPWESESPSLSPNSTASQL